MGKGYQIAGPPQILLLWQGDVTEAYIRNACYMLIAKIAPFWSTRMIEACHANL